MALLILIVLFEGHAEAQDFARFPQGFGIEIGAGYNQLLWRAKPVMGVTPGMDYHRREFALTPTIRVCYDFYPISVLQVHPFVGYSQFGGKSETSSAGYRDEIWIHALEFGLVMSYGVGDLRLGGGIKYNRHFNVRHHYYGTVYQTTPRSWEVEEDAIFLQRNSLDCGPRISWLLSRWSFSVEAWIGVTALQRDELDEYLAIRENHYRILVAYTL